MDNTPPDPVLQNISNMIDEDKYNQIQLKIFQDLKHKRAADLERSIRMSNAKRMKVKK